MLVGAHNGAPAKVPVDVVPIAETLWQVTPWNACAIAMQHRLSEETVKASTERRDEDRSAKRHDVECRAGNFREAGMAEGSDTPTYLTASQHNL